VILTPWRHCKHAVLQRILRGRLVFRPHINPISGEIDGYDFRGLTRFDKLFTGLAVERPAGLVRGDTTGCEDIGPGIRSMATTGDCSTGRMKKL
jgi:hypothetical protein